MTTNARLRRRPGTLLLFVACAVGLTLALAGGAHAQSDAQKQNAKEHFEKASRLYDVGRYSDAVEEYQKAYLNVEDPVFLFNIAQCYRLSDRPVEAVRFYRNYLRRAPSAPNRSDVERRISEMDKLIQEREKAGMAPAAPPPIVVEPPVERPPAATSSPAVTPPPAAAPSIPPPGTDVSARAQTGSSDGTRSLAYGLMIGGGAGIVVAALCGAGAAAKAHTVETSSKFNPSDEKAGKTLNALAIGFGVAGAAAAITGGVLLLINRPAGGVALGPSPRRQAHLVPLLAPGLAGAEARFAF